MRGVFACCVLLGLASAASAQEGFAPAVNTPVAATPDGKRWCDLYFSETGGKDVVVLDQDGRYLPDVREVYVLIRVGAAQPSAKLVSWRGIYKPSNLKASDGELWPVRNIKTVTVADFQKLVDKLEAPAAAK